MCEVDGYCARPPTPRAWMLFPAVHQHTTTPRYSGSYCHPSHTTPTMEMWKMLTQQFKAHSLDEDIESFQEVDDRDSGTESDEENAELQAIEEAMQHSKRDQENQPQVLPPVGGYQTGCPGFQPLTLQPSDNSPTHPLQLVSQTMVPFQALSHNTTHHYGVLYDSPERNSSSLQETSDYECCSLDYDPSSSLDYDVPLGRSVDFDQHSSEDELTFINCGSGGGSSRGREMPHNVPEKRKWSQRCNSCNDSSGSSDEEVRDLLGQPKPLNFSSSPPSGVRRVSQTLLSPKLFLARLPTPNNIRLCTLSPRKRHRPMSATDVSGATSGMQRPCLDFEKMQKTLFRRRLPHGVTKTRIVKIRLGLLKGSM